MSENPNHQEPDYRIPEGMRVYAIGDIHGYAHALDALHEKIAFDLADYAGSAHIVYLGDYIDRGPDSKGVIDRLIERADRKDGVERTFLTGNHELALMAFLSSPLSSNWLFFGGIETLESYGIYFENKMPLPGEIEQAAQDFSGIFPSEHLAFFQDLKFLLSVGDYLFVHAGVNPLKPIDRQTERDLTEIREPFLDWHKDPAYKPLEKKVVHGHSLYRVPENRPHRVSVDTGLYKGGALTAAVLEGNDVRFLQVK